MFMLLLDGNKGQWADFEKRASERMVIQRKRVEPVLASRSALETPYNFVDRVVVFG